jgi:hypothetical protein
LSLLAINRHYAQNPSMSVMAFHEKAGPGQVDFALPFLKFPFPSWREGVQSGPERSRARSVRRSEPLTARTDLSPFRQEGKGAVVLDLSICSPFLLCAQTKAVATLPSALSCERFIRSVQVGCSRFSRCCHLIFDLFHLAIEVGPGH